MSRVYYDFHIHTALSPCGDEDMTPNNIVNMAVLNGLDAIAVTDHNTCGNAAAVMSAAAGKGLIVIPGMELETAEEAHVVCLFADCGSASAFARIVESRLPKIKNREGIYGRQLFFDAADEITGVYENLLVTATAIELAEAVGLAQSHGGVAIPAHVDRGSYSVISNLGFIPAELDISNIEISKMTEPGAFFSKFSRSLPRGYGCVRSSDAHYLGDISERGSFIELDGAPTAGKIIGALKKALPRRG